MNFNQLNHKYKNIELLPSFPLTLNLILLISIQILSICDCTSITPKTTNPDFACICSSIKRPICGFTSTGIIMQFDNICAVKCEAARNKDFKFSILTPSLCQKGLNSYLDEKSRGKESQYLKEWIDYIEEEINFWKPIEQSLDALLLA